MTPFFPLAHGRPLARKHNPNLKAFYERLVQAGKKPLVAITAIMRKLVIIANAKLKSLNALQLS
jgi:transposase